MSARFAVAAIVTALSVAACGVVPPIESPSGDPPTQPSVTLSASPDSGLRIDDPAYLAGDAFLVPVGDAGADWTAPSSAPVMPNGQWAARVAFLPASCAASDFTITADAPPEDDWETALREDNYDFTSWPGPQVPECSNGQQDWTYLQVAYHPFIGLGVVHLVASVSNVIDAPSEVEVLPVFSSADATQPALVSDGSMSMGAIPGPSKPRSVKAQFFASFPFNATTLPDGTAPTSWALEVTGCGPVGGKPMVVTARVGGSAQVEIGTCMDGGMSSEWLTWSIPSDGTKVTLLLAGGTTKSHVRVSEFQWRGDRP